jgi:mannose-6-phosphate isomerase-like protein (cupin superfamily)
MTHNIHPGDHYWGDWNAGAEVIAEKAWGTEVIITRGTDTGYAVKVMTLKPGMQVSMHWHGKKCETFVLVAGRMTVEILLPSSKKQIIVLTEPFSSITLRPQTPHTFYAPDDQVGDTIFIEASTLDHPDDSYRLTKSGPRK